MANATFSTDTSVVLFAHQFGVRRAVRIAAQNRGVPFAAAERAAVRHLCGDGDRTAAILAGIDQLAQAA